MYSDSRKNMPKIEVPRRKPITFAPVSVRRLKMLSGTSGERERSSMAMKAAMSTAESTNAPIVLPEVHPLLVVCVRPYTSAMRLAVTVTAPAASKCCSIPSARDSATKRGTKNSAISAIGRLTKKTASQLTYSVSTPPSSTPMAAPEPAIPPRMPSALFRSAPSLNVTKVIEKTDGERIAPAAPWARRAAMSMPGLVDSPAQSEVAKNSARPTMNSRRRPSRSPARPPRSRKPPKVNA